MNKKDFTGENPALSFISVEQPENSSEDKSLEEEIHYKPDPRYIETKSKKMQILIQPTVFKMLKKYAQEHHISANETVNKAIKAYLNIDI